MCLFNHIAIAILKPKEFMSDNLENLLIISFSKIFNAYMSIESEPCIILKWMKKMIQTLRQHRYSLLGITLANLSGVVFTINNCIIQIMKLDFSELMLIRGAIQLIFLSMMIFANGQCILPTVGENQWKVRLATIFQGMF